MKKLLFTLGIFLHTVLCLPIQAETATIDSLKRELQLAEQKNSKPFSLASHMTNASCSSSQPVASFWGSVLGKFSEFRVFQASRSVLGMIQFNAEEPAISNLFQKNTGPNCFFSL